MATDNHRFNESYYRTAYRDYQAQNPPHKLAFYVSLVDKVRPDRRATLIDMGCGLGAFLRHLRSTDPIGEVWRLIGTDVSEFAISRNQAEIPGVDFFVHGLEEEMRADLVVDVVTAFDVLEHLEALDRAASAIHRLLHRDGSVIFVVPVYDGPLGPVITLADHDSTHLQKHSRAWWLNWAGRYFNVIDWLGVFRGPTPWGGYIHLPTRRLRRWAPAIVVTARRA